MLFDPSNIYKKGAIIDFNVRIILSRTDYFNLKELFYEKVVKSQIISLPKMICRLENPRRHSNVPGQ